MTQRTDSQNKALHKFCELLAAELNDAGLDQRVVLKPSVAIPWTKQAVKDQLWRPIQQAMLDKTSTTELDKHMEIDKVHEVLMRHLAERFGIEYIEFPFDPDKFSNY